MAQKQIVAVDIKMLMKTKTKNVRWKCAHFTPLHIVQCACAGAGGVLLLFVLFSFLLSRSITLSTFHCNSNQLFHLCERINGDYNDDDAAAAAVASDDDDDDDVGIAFAIFILRAHQHEWAMKVSGKNLSISNINWTTDRRMRTTTAAQPWHDMNWDSGNEFYRAIHILLWCIFFFHLFFSFLFMQRNMEGVWSHAHLMWLSMCCV